ncbi:MAG TPA: glycosyltransferase family 4 protein [Thermoanaerobacterales bacterium]|nr:glycosyltransferase family 4 protein [Thermoanaerobacterales bacterium]
MKILALATLQGLHKPQSGGQQRFYNLVSQLTERGHDLTVLIPESFKNINDSDNVHYYKDLYFRKRKLSLLYDFNFHLLKKLSKLLKDNDYDIIQIAGPTGILSCKILCRLLKKRPLIVYDAHNVESDLQSYLFRNNPEYSPFEKFFMITYTYFQERFATKCCDLILAVSDNNKERFIAKYKIAPEKIKVIPSGANTCTSTKSDNKLRLKRGDEKIIVFHGSYFHYPNKEAMDLIKDFIAPEILKIYGDSVKFLVMGPEVPKFKTENLISLGFVEDLFSVLKIADIAIVPLRGGDGTKLKIFDYLVMGVPVISTKKGAEGIDVVNGEDMIIVDEVNELFIDELCRLLDDDKLRSKLSKNSLKVAENYSWSNIGEKLHNFYKEERL